MIDVHVLTHEGTRQDWLDQCLASLRSEPVNVHVVDNAGRSVGQGRARGYALGSAPYVAYVDSDDYVIPGCFDACLEALQHNHAVVTLEQVERNGFVIPVPKPAHNVAVYLRSDVEPYLHLMELSPHTTDWHMRRIVKPVQLSTVGYVWRVHAAGDHHKTIAALEEEHPLWQTA